VATPDFPCILLLLVIFTNIHPNFILLAVFAFIHLTCEGSNQLAHLETFTFISTFAYGLFTSKLQREIFITYFE